MARVMREINLTEYERSGRQRLSVVERDTLISLTNRDAGDARLSLAIEPTAGAEDQYDLTPGPTIGAVEVDGLSVLIEPKIGIPQVLSLACYAIGKVRFQKGDFGFPNAPALPDFLALALGRAARKAFSRGLLHGYRTEEDALLTVRGRIRFDEQIRRRPGILSPIEVQYDEFTDDILANQLVKAAAYRLGRMRLRSREARWGLGWIAGMLDNVSFLEWPQSDVPEMTFDRLNEHYRDVTALSRLVLRHGAFESRRGHVRASGFLMNMNDVFQEFVTVALREKLGVSADMLKEQAILSLDEGGRVHLRPDLVWQDGGRCVFVGDAKYKRLADERIPNADLYQLLAYATALSLPGGLLIYAKGERDPRTYTIRNSDKRLEVAALDLSGTVDEALERVGELAERVRALRPAA